MNHIPHLKSFDVNIRLHNCKIKEVVDLTGTLTKPELKLLSKGTGYIPKSKRLALKALEITRADWGWSSQPNPHIDKCSNRDHLTMLNLKKRDDIIIKKADKGNAFVVLTHEQYKFIANKQLSISA